MHKSPIRLGLVGLGKIARDQHLPTIRANPRFELVATASPDGNAEGVPAFAALATMLDAVRDPDGVPAIDAVCLCTPPGVRADLARRAITAGCHVMLEKPPAASLSQVAALSGAARLAGRTLLASWHSRETAAVDLARAWLAGQRVMCARVVWREDIRQWHPGQDWLLEAGGFGVFDPAINAFSVLTRILPGALEVIAADLAIPVNRAAAMEAQVAMLHDGIAAVTCDLSIIHPGAPLWDITIDTAAGLLYLGQGGRHLTIDGTPRRAEGPGEYARVYDRFATLIDAEQSDVDTRPLTLVADALMLGRRRALPAFDF
jgi:D-galactose 1-dehydrogenase/L-arabinose 1- dehydrogenase